MVSIFTIVNLVVSVILIFAAPLLFFYYFRSKKGMFRTMAAGAMGFFIAQYVLRIPILNNVLSSSDFSFILDDVLLYALLLGVSAAALELLFRIIILKWFMADYQQKHHVLSAGFGHGLIEAIFLVALTYINNIILSIYINNNNIDQLFDQASDVGAINQVVQGLINSSSWVFLLGGLERIMVLIIHVAVTIVVFKGLKNKNQRLKLWGFAFVFHASLDVAIVLMQLSNTSIWLMEGLILIFALISVKIVVEYIKEKPIKEQI